MAVNIAELCADVREALEAGRPNVTLVYDNYDDYAAALAAMQEDSWQVFSYQRGNGGITSGARQGLSTASNVLEHHLEDQAGHRVQVGGERPAAHPQRFQRNGAAAGERIHHQRRVLAVRRLHQRAAGLQPRGMAGHVPIGEVRDELQQDAPQPVVRLDGLRPPLRPPLMPKQNPPRRALERRRTVFVARVRQQQRHQHRPTRRQRPARPPQMQRARMPMPNRLLPHGVTGDLGDWEVDFG